MIWITPRKAQQRRYLRLGSRLTELAPPVVSRIAQTLKDRLLYGEPED